MGIIGGTIGGSVGGPGGSVVGASVGGGGCAQLIGLLGLAQFVHVKQRS